MEITKASQDDIDGIYNLFIRIFGGLGDYYHTKWTKESERCVKKWITLVAKEDRKIVGFLVIRQLKDGVTAIVEWFGIIEEYRNKKTGTKMMKKMLKGLKMLGYKKVVIRASNRSEHNEGAWKKVNYGDSKAVKFYRRFGFRYRKGWMKAIL